MKKYLVYIILLLSSCQINTKPAALKGDYLGQNLPENEPVLFASGIINTGISVRDITFMPDKKEIYFVLNVANSRYATIFFCKETQNGWTSPEVVSFATNSDYIFIEPFITPDGSKMFFVSNKGNSFTEENRFITDIWVTNRKDNSWGEPYKLDKVINSSESEFFPSVAENGNLYFTRENPDTKEGYIYVSEYKNGKFQEPVKLPEQINTGTARFNATISPDESFIIVPIYGMSDSYGSTDYYISFRDHEKGWSEPMNLGEKINSASGLEYSTNFSPDGQYFFYMSSKIEIPEFEKASFEQYKKILHSPESGNSNIYWIKADFISDLKEKATFIKNE